MNRINYQRKLDRLIESFSGADEPPTLLLHCCCGPCSSYTLEYLSDYFQITAFFYNPNIAPREEYDHRFSEFRRLVSEMHTKYPITIIEGEYHPSVFYEAVRGLEKEPELGKRCFVCYRLRMERAALLAQKFGCDFFTTTLSISPKKNADKINEIGESLSEIYHVKHLPSDFKRKKGYERSIVITREHQIYRQDYCGCVFSMRHDITSQTK
jgi:epoxyqueuosine reductase